MTVIQSNMRTLFHKNRRGFTLIELMILVVIVGVLSAMGTASYQHQVARSKTGEPRRMLGAMQRGVSIAYERDWTKAEVLVLGGASQKHSNSEEPGKVTGSTSGKGKGKGATVEHDPLSSVELCGSATPVPDSISKVKQAKYQSGPEWDVGDNYSGWPCLGFRINGPQYYQYGYDLGGPKVMVTLPKGGNPKGLSDQLRYTAWARGDLDGDGRTSLFVTEGGIIGGKLVHATGIGITDETE